MKFKVHLGGQAYNLYLGSNISNLCMTPVYILDAITEYSDPRLKSNNGYADPITYTATDYALDGFSTLSLKTCYAQQYFTPYYNDAYGSNNHAATFCFNLPPEIGYNPYPVFEESLLAVSGHFGQIMLRLVFNSDNASTTWKFSGIMYPSMHFHDGSVTFNTFLNWFCDYNGYYEEGRCWQGIEPYVYDYILKFQLFDGPENYIPDFSERDPLINYGTIYFGFSSTTDTLEYIGYTITDPDSWDFYAYNIDYGYLDINCQKSRLDIKYLP